MTSRSAFMTALVLALSSMGCVAGGAGGTDPGTNGVGNGAAAGGGAGNGAGGGAAGTGASNGAGATGAAANAYWSWDTVQTWTVTDEGGYASQAFRFFFWTFDASGYAYVGAPTPDFEGTACPGPASDGDGQPRCVPYTKSGNTTVVQLAKPVTLTMGPASGTLARNELRAIPSLAGQTMNATYKSYTCSMQTCSQAEITFTSDGHYRFAQANIFRGQLGDVFTTAAGLQSSAGTYVVGPQSITFTTDDGKSNTFFFFRDKSAKSDTVQIADTWFLIK